MTQTVFVLSDTRPGHFNQSLGILANFPASDFATVVKDLPSPRRAWKNPALLGASIFRRHAGILRSLYRAYYRTNPPARLDARFILSTGGDTLVANVILSRLFNIPNVFVGKRSGFTDMGVELLFVMEGQPVTERIVLLDFGPVNVPEMAPPVIKPQPELLAVLIGGNSSEYSYTADDYRALADALNSLCERNGIRLLLTTSRRTGTEGEAILRQHISAPFLADATWYNSAPRPVTRDYCSRADAILCSEDSGTMLSEAIHYQRPVFSFRPRTRRMTRFYQLFLDRLASRNVVFSDISDLPSLPVSATPAAIPPDNAPVRDAIRKLLQHHTQDCT